jgi:hypothetical protein
VVARGSGGGAGQRRRAAAARDSGGAAVGVGNVAHQQTSSHFPPIAYNA